MIGAMGVLHEIVFDCEHPASLARFWTEVLDGFDVRPYDDAAIARLAERGLTPETDPIVMVDGPDLVLCFQKTDSASAAKNKVHLDVATAHRVDVVKQLCALRASVAAEFKEHTWLRDPEGNDFCLTDRR